MTKINIRRDILSKIEKEEIRMKPRWFFQLEEGGIRGVWLLLILAGSVAISMIYYFIEVYNPGQLFKDYGEIGRDLFLTDFPHLWLLGIIIFVGGGCMLLTRVGSNYKKTTKKLILLTAIFVAGATMVVVVVRSLLKL